MLPHTGDLDMESPHTKSLLLLQVPHSSSHPSCTLPSPLLHLHASDHHLHHISPPSALSLQAYFFRAKLPITDYINDTKTVLDQAPRVLNALLDVAVEMGLLDVALALTVLSKMIVQVTHPLSPPPPLLRAIVNC